MIPRNAASKALELSRQYPVLTITGPRQSGKMTLCRQNRSDREHVQRRIFTITFGASLLQLFRCYITFMSLRAIALSF